MLKNRNEIKEILEMNISDNDKIDRIAKLGTTRTDIGRVILTDELLDWKEGQIITKVGRHWADRNNNNISNIGYQPDSGMGDIEYFISVENVKGYKVPYYNEYYFQELGYDYDESIDKAAEMEEDEVYRGLLDLIGSDPDMEDECEILISNDKKFKIDLICDERDETGYITVELVEVK